MTGVIAECVTGTEEARWTWVEALTPQHVGRKYSEMLPAEDLARCFSWRHWLKLEAEIGGDRLTEWTQILVMCRRIGDAR